MEGFGERFSLNSRLTQNKRVIIPYLLEIFEQFKLLLELEIHDISSGLLILIGKFGR